MASFWDENIMKQNLKNVLILYQIYFNMNQQIYKTFVNNNKQFGN